MAELDYIPFYPGDLVQWVEPNHECPYGLVIKVNSEHKYKILVQWFDYVPGDIMMHNVRYHNQGNTIKLVRRASKNKS